jgi:hypothetical protein
MAFVNDSRRDLAVRARNGTGILALFTFSGAGMTGLGFDR